MNNKVLIGIAVVAVLVLLYGWSVYNTLITTNETATNAWQQVETEYQRRADLIPNLVSTVKGFAAQESKVFKDVTDARAQVGQTKIDIANATPAQIAQFQSAQNSLGSALTRLLAVAENYPQLKSNENFLTLQSQIEGTENRVSVERKRFNDAIRTFNLAVKRFPSSLIAGMFGFAERTYFEAIEGAENVPEVRF